MEERRLLSQPSITAAAFDFETFPNTVTLTFDQNVSASLASSDITIFKEGGDFKLTGTGASVSYNSSTNVATYTLPNTVSLNGDYFVQVLSPDVKNAGNETLTSDFRFDFWYLPGDIDRDRDADNDDLAIMTQNLDTAGTYSDGDFDYSGYVDTDDQYYFSAGQLPAPLHPVERLSVWTNGNNRDLAWYVGSKRITNVRVQRSLDRKTWTNLVQLGATANTYTDTTASGQNCYYRVRGVYVDVNTNNAYTPFRKPGDPTQTSPGSVNIDQIAKNSVRLNWTDTNSSETGYEVWHSLDNTNWTKIKTTAANATNYTFTNLKAARLQYFKVRALGADNVSKFVSTSATTSSGAPAVIGGFLDVSSVPHKFYAEVDQAIVSAPTAGNTSMANLSGYVEIASSSRTMSIGSGSERILATMQGSLGGVVNGALPEGNYEFIVKENSFAKTGSVTNPDEGVAIGFFLRGDFDGDREITEKDVKVTADNYGGSNKTYSQGDTDYDGDVDFADLLYVGQHAGVVLAEPPTSPGELVAYTATLDDPTHEMKLDWTAPEEDFDGFKIFRGTDGVNFEEIDDVDAETFTFNDSELTDGTKYWYRVRGYVDTGSGLEFSSTSNKASGLTIIAPVSDVSYTRIDNEEIVVSWTNNSESATEIEIYRREAEPGDGPETIITETDWVLVAQRPPSNDNWSDHSTMATTNHQYLIKVTNTHGTSTATGSQDGGPTSNPPLDGSETVGLDPRDKTSLHVFIGDQSESDSETWSMKVGGKWHYGPEGDVQHDQRDFKRGEAYPISVRHDDSTYSAGNEDFDYRAWIDHLSSPTWGSGPATPSGDNYFVVDDNSPKLLQRDWYDNNQNHSNNALNKTATLVIPGIDLDVDTDNNQGYNPFADDLPEDLTEEENDKGKYVIANTGDLDDDGISDFADLGGIAGGKFTPLLLRLPESMALAGATLANITMSLTYSMSDISEIGPTSTSPNVNQFRIWTVDASSSRGETELLRSGEPFTAEDIELGFGETKPLFIEAVRGSTINRPITVAATFDGNVWDGSVLDRVYVAAVGFKLKSVELKAAPNDTLIPIESDMGNTLDDEPHWEDSNLDGTPNRSWPAAYVAQDTMASKREIEVTAPQFALDGNFALVGDGPASYDFYSRSTDDAGDPLNTKAELDGDLITCEDVAATPFPGGVSHFNSFKIKWKISLDGGSTYVSVQDTDHQVYVFRSAPTMTVVHSVAHVSTLGANGTTTDAGVANGIWNEFSDRIVKRARLIGPQELNSDVTLAYAHDNQSYADLTSLLRYGKGRCGAWAEFLRDCLRVHGIAAKKITVLPPTISGQPGWVAQDQELLNVIETPAQGTGAQNYTALTTFYDHSVVYSPTNPNTIFDPSYGTITTGASLNAAELQWEQAAVAHFSRQFQDNANNIQWVNVTNDTTKQCTFTMEP